MKMSFNYTQFFSNILSATFLVLLMTITFVDVIGRNLLNHPLLGATELTEYTLVAVTFLAYPVVALRHGHVSVDILDPVFRKTGVRILIAFGDLLGAVVFGLLAYRMWLQGLRLLSYGDETPQLGIPIAPAYFFMSILAGLTVIAFLIAAVSGEHKDPNKPADEVI